MRQIPQKRKRECTLDQNVFSTKSTIVRPLLQNSRYIRLKPIETRLYPQAGRSAAFSREPEAKRRVTPLNLAQDDFCKSYVFRCKGSPRTSSKTLTFWIISTEISIMYASSLRCIIGLYFLPHWVSEVFCHVRGAGGCRSVIWIPTNTRVCLL